GEPAQMGRRGFQVLYCLSIRFTEHNWEHCVDVVRVGRPSLAGVEIGGNRVVADVGEPPCDILDMLDEPEGFMDHDNARIPPGLARLGEIALDRVATAFEVDRLAAHA